METIQRAASAATDAIFGEHGEHGQNAQGTTTDATTRTNATGETAHEPLSGKTGNTKAGEPYDAGNLGDETSQQRIAASRGDTTGTTGTTGTSGYTSTTSTTGATGGYSSNNNTSTTTGEGEPRRSSDISPRSGPAAGTIPIPSSANTASSARQGGSYSNARETAARAMGSAETPSSGAGAAYSGGAGTGGAGHTGAAAGAGAGAAAGGAGLWSAGQKRDGADVRDENGYLPGEDGYTGKGAEEAGKSSTTGTTGQQSQQGQNAKFAGAGEGEADAADVTPSRAHTEGKKIKDAGESSTASSSGGPGAGAGAVGAGAAGAGAGAVGAGAAGAGASKTGGDSAGEGAPLGRRESLTGHLPGEPGGEGMRRTSGEGTGEQWVKSSGMKADGGDFDASAPGAGREADRLLTEKGIKRSGADEKKVTGQMDTKAPNGGNSEGEKAGGGLKDKLKNKLHKA